MGALLDPQKNDQQRKSECHLLLSRTLGVYLNICRKPDSPNRYPADSWDYSGHISALMFCAFLLRNSQ